jgi:hypothetical protein
MCDLTECPRCGERITHPSNPGRHDSHSDLGQHIHDTDGGRALARSFDYSDIDGVIWKSEHRLLRILESKPGSDPLKPSQWRILPLLARGIAELCRTRHGFRGLHIESGVYVVRGRPPFENPTIQKVPPAGPRLSRARVLKADDWTRFKRGEPLNPPLGD